MMQALLLLSSYGINYINNFLSQFNNDKRFDIFIHLDRKSKSDFENHKKIIKSNIKYIKHLYEFKRFSIQMADVMVNLLIIVEKIWLFSFF